jgi:hypothetical protein
MNLKLKCFFYSVTSCSAITEVPEVSDDVASIASSAGVPEGLAVPAPHRVNLVTNPYI